MKRMTIEKELVGTASTEESLQLNVFSKNNIKPSVIYPQKYP